MFGTAIRRTLARGIALGLIVCASLGQMAGRDVRAAQARERVLYVSAVEDATRKPVTDLTARDIVVREDGVQREVLRIGRPSSPMAIAVVVDNSQAATPAITDLRKGLTSFINDVQGLGPTALITVADRPTIVADYTTTPKTLQDAIGRLFAMPGSGATLLDAIVEVSKGLRKREEDRAGIVIITTEHVEFSLLHYQQVLDPLRESGAALHAVVLTNPAGQGLDDAARNRSTVLDRGPRETGGIRIDVLTSMAFESQLRELADILKTQHRVVYARPESLIPPDRVEVSSARARLEVRGTPARGQAKR